MAPAGPLLRARSRRGDRAASSTPAFGADDDEVDGAMELVEKPMDQVELQHAIDAALDNGDHAEFLRLSALKESRTILLFEGFCKKLRGNRDI